MNNRRSDRKKFITKNHSNEKKRFSDRKDFSRLRLFIEYEGTRYSGWQKQENAKTIQGTISKAAQEIFGDGFVDLQGSGRTDSGVHAICQVAHLDAKTMRAPEIIRMKLNDLLPAAARPPAPSHLRGRSRVLLAVEMLEKHFCDAHREPDLVCDPVGGAACCQRKPS